MFKVKAKRCVPDRSCADGNNRQSPPRKENRRNPLQLMEKTDEIRENEWNDKRVRSDGNRDMLRKHWYMNEQRGEKYLRKRLISHISFVPPCRWRADFIIQGQAWLFLWFEGKGKQENNNNTPFQLMLETALTADLQYGIKHLYLFSC